MPHFIQNIAVNELQGPFRDSTAFITHDTTLVVLWHLFREMKEYHLDK